MKDLLLPLLHLAVTAAKLCRPGGVRAALLHESELARTGAPGSSNRPGLGDSLN